MKLKKNTSTLLRGLFQVFVVGSLMLSLFVTSPAKAATGVDLVITGYTITPPNPGIGEAFTISVTIENQGTSSSLSTVYRHVFVDTGDPNLLPLDPGNQECPNTTDDDIYENYFREDLNQELDPGIPDTRDINIPNGLATGGAHELWLYVDALCTNSEDNETNNAYGPISFVLPGLSSGPTDVDVTIGGVSRGVYPMVPDTSAVKKYALDGGPVVISSNNDVGIVASLNQWRRRPSTTVGWTGVSQSMALPVSQITNEYYFPRYDYSNTSALYNAMLIANVDTVTRVITIKIGGVVRGTYTLAPSQSQFINYPGVVGGPVVVSSDPGAKIVASLYELIRDPNLPGWNGQSEMMGLPATQLSDQYLIPNYFGAINPNTLNASLYIANVDTVSTTVEIRIAGVLRGTYALAANTGQVAKYNVDGGPVEIRSTNGARIVASLNQWRRRPSTTVGWTGVSQSMALPVSQITNEYYIPRYDYSNTSALYNAMLIANVDTVTRVITIKIGGVVRGTYTLAPSQSQFINYPGVVGGPVVVSSVPGAKIVASLYELIRDPNLPGWNGQSEMMGLPATQLSDQYLIPNYFGAINPNTLNASLYIAVP